MILVFLFYITVAFFSEPSSSIYTLEDDREGVRRVQTFTVGERRWTVAPMMPPPISLPQERKTFSLWCELPEVGHDALFFFDPPQPRPRLDSVLGATPPPSPHHCLKHRRRTDPPPPVRVGLNLTTPLALPRLMRGGRGPLPLSTPPNPSPCVTICA